MQKRVFRNDFRHSFFTVIFLSTADESMREKLNIKDYKSTKLNNHTVIIPAKPCTKVATVCAL